MLQTSDILLHTWAVIPIRFLTKGQSQIILKCTFFFLNGRTLKCCFINHIVVPIRGTQLNGLPFPHDFENKLLFRLGCE